MISFEMSVITLLSFQFGCLIMILGEVIGLRKSFAYRDLVRDVESKNQALNSAPAPEIS